MLSTPLYNGTFVPDYTETTHGVCITVTTEYLPKESRPQEHFFAWSYQVRIENQSARTVQLLHRYWHITDGYGHVQEVRGPGVIGQQPVLRPGTSFNYASWTHLPSPNGLMRGHYEMQEIVDRPGSPGEIFLTPVPAFSLDSDEQIARPN